MLKSTYPSLPACGSQRSSQVVRDDRKEFRISANEIPALAGTLALLELLLQSPTLDVEALTQVVRSDVGLSIQALRQSRAEAVGSNELWRISDCVIHLGPRLLQLARPLYCRTEDCKNAYAEAEAFWKHSRLVAAVAETTAACLQELDVSPERAYLAGLMRNLDRLPDVLDFVSSGGAFCTIQGWVMGCNLPAFAGGALLSAHNDLIPSEMTKLSRVVCFSQRWIDLCLPWSQNCMARRSHFALSVPLAEGLIHRSFPEIDADALPTIMESLRDATLWQLDEQRATASEVVLPHRLFRNAGAPLNYLRGETSTDLRDSRTVGQV